MLAGRTGGVCGQDLHVSFITEYRQPIAALTGKRDSKGVPPLWGRRSSARAGG